MKEIIKTVYVADDGTEFSNKKECEMHEGIKLWDVTLEFEGVVSRSVFAKTAREARDMVLDDYYVEDIDFSLVNDSVELSKSNFNKAKEDA